MNNTHLQRRNLNELPLKNVEGVPFFVVHAPLCSLSSLISSSYFTAALKSRRKGAQRTVCGRGQMNGERENEENVRQQRGIVYCVRFEVINLFVNCGSAQFINLLLGEGTLETDYIYKGEREKRVGEKERMSWCFCIDWEGEVAVSVCATAFKKYYKKFRRSTLRTHLGNPPSPSSSFFYSQ